MIRLHLNAIAFRPRLRLIGFAVFAGALALGAMLHAADAKKTGKSAAQQREVARAQAFFAADASQPRIAIDVPPDLLKGLNVKPRESVRATVRVTFPGQPEVTYKDVGLHLKGGPGSFRKVEERPALNLNFDKFVEGQQFHGLEKILLNNSVQDGSYMCEALCGMILRESGGFAARASNARVVLNGRDWGLYVVKEGFDGPFLRMSFGNDSGNLYEGSFTDVDGNLPVHFGKKVKPPGDPADKEAKKQYDARVAADRAAASAKLKELADACRERDPSARKSKLEKVLDVDAFLTFMACETIIAHWDGYAGNRNNYRIYHNPGNGLLYFVAHGMDQVFQRPDYPLTAANNAMVCRAVLETPADRQRYLDRLAQIRAKVFTPERMTAEIDRLSARLMPLAKDLGPDAVKRHQAETAGLRDRVAQRIANMDKQFARLAAPLAFDSSGSASLATQPWEAHQSSGGAALDKVTESGRELLHIKMIGEGRASWRLGLNLAPGKYAIEGRVRTAKVVPAAAPPPNPAGASIGLRNTSFAPPLTGTLDWTPVRQIIEITDASAEYIFSCQLSAKSGEAFFDLTSLKLVRQK